MANKTEIECIQRLQDLTGSVEDIMTFLLEEKLLTNEDVKYIKSSSNRAKSLCLMLHKLKTTGQLQLLEYEWNILPVERIKILFVTDRTSKEFGYNF